MHKIEQKTYNVMRLKHSGRNFVDLLNFLDVPWISNIFPEPFVEFFGSESVQEFIRQLGSMIQTFSRQVGSGIMYMTRHFALHDECLERFICDLINMPRNFDDLKRRQSQQNLHPISNHPVHIRFVLVDNG